MWLGEQINKLAADKSGAALLEVAVVIPVVLSIGLGVIEFGNAIYSQHLIFNGVRDAARYVAGLPQTNADDTINAALVASNITAGKNIAVWGTKTNAASDTCGSGSTSTMISSRRLNWWCAPSNVAVTYTSFANDDGTAAHNKIYRGGTTIQTVTVTATVPYQSLGFMSYFNLAEPTFSLSHTERLFGVR